MKKYFFLYIILNIFSLHAEPNLSPIAKEIYYRLANGNPNSSNYELLKDFPLKEISLKNKNLENIQSSVENFSVSCLIKVNKNFSAEKVQNLGIHTVKISDEIYTVQIPVNSYVDFIRTDGLEYMQADGFAAPFLDSALIAAKVTEVKKGTNNLPKSYTGKGVIVGIIDWGFDYTHPAFYDSVNQKCRITKVWDQTVTGTPPAQFSYGTELANPEAIKTAKTDYTDASHGSHVAGIAAGEAWPTFGKYEGIATDAEIVMVALRHPRPEFTGYTNAFSDFIDAAKYIFDYAESVGKPVAVNLSWGNVMGPKDGKSIVSDALESMVGKGKIFIGSAGNSGTNNVHCSFNCSPQDTLLKTYLTYASNISFTPKEVFVDTWGESGKKYEINISALKSSATREVVCETGFINLDKDTILTFRLPYLTNDTVTVTAFVKKLEYNTRPRILLQIKSKNYIYFQIEGKSQNSEIHLFTSLLKNGTGYIAPFINLNDTNALKGDSKYTICDWVSSDRILCIGASVSKESYTNTKGQTLRLNQGKSGYRAEFSSIGPAMDKRVKPDLAAPGSVLVSSVNSFDKNYPPNSSSADMVTRLNFNGGTYTYSAYQGTSMSSPVVTGSVALLLEAKPDLTPEEVIDLLKSTATRDTCTSDTLPDFYWGYGKLNLINAMGKLLGINSAEENELVTSQNFIYPNPVNNPDIINLGINSTEYTEYSVFDISGNKVETGSIIGQFKLKNKNLSDGVYFIKLTGKDKSLTRKLIIKR